MQIHILPWWLCRSGGNGMLGAAAVCPCPAPCSGTGTHTAVLQSESATLLCAVNPSNRSKLLIARNEEQLAVYL